MTPPLSQILDTLEQHLLSLREEGVRTLPWSGAQPTPSVSRREQPAPSAAAVPPQSPAPADPLPTPPALVLAAVGRLPECGDHRPSAEHTLALVISPAELTGTGRELLGGMLRAIGYPLPDQFSPLSDPPSVPAGCARILCFGEEANLALSPLRMALSLVRGKWQTLPSGRMLATFAPSYLLDNPAGKKTAWTDLQRVLEDMGLELPEWSRPARPAS